MTDDAPAGLTRALEQAAHRRLAYGLTHLYACVSLYAWDGGWT